MSKTILRRTLITTYFWHFVINCLITSSFLVINSVITSYVLGINSLITRCVLVIYSLIAMSVLVINSLWTTSFLVINSLLDRCCYQTVNNIDTRSCQIRVITKLPNSEQSYKGKVKTHKYINRQNQSTTACTKSGSLRFSQFSGCWLILSVYILMSFDFPFVRLFGVR
jgi:ABC-type bacteriocin/lantibiotic exporter with double-glycine peptidase domain